MVGKGSLKALAGLVVGLEFLMISKNYWGQSTSYKRYPRIIVK